ncbi:hypothetical protein ACNKHX_13025 [Shigella flexneri]
MVRWIIAAVLSGTLSHKPTAIRGNASEIMALAGAANGGREWIPLTPPERDTRCTNTGTGKRAIVAWSLARWIMLQMVVVSYVSRWRSVNDQSRRNWLCVAVVAACCTLQGDGWKFSHLPVTG